MSLLLVFLALAPPDTLDLSPYDRLDRALDSLQVRYEVPGFAVAVVADGEVAFARGYGWADVEGRRPVTAATPFRIASLTKPLAAAVLLRLVERGHLDLDRPFADYVAGYDRGCQLFTSPEVLAEEPALRGLTEDWRCEAERDRLTVRHYLTHTAQGEPGAVFHYNGFLYGQLFRVAEGVSEQPFADILRDDLFAPLGMDRTLPSQADSTRPDVLAALARPYRTGAGRAEPADWPRPLDANAGAGVVSTVLDLARFDTALDGGPCSGRRRKRRRSPPRGRAQRASGSRMGLGGSSKTTGGSRSCGTTGGSPVPTRDCGSGSRSGGLH